MNFLLFFAVLGILLRRSRNFVPFWREAACDYGFLLLPFLLFCFCFLCRPRFVQLGFFAEPLLSTCLFNFLPFLLHILFVCLTRLRGRCIFAFVFITVVFLSCASSQFTCCALSSAHSSFNAPSFLSFSCLLRSYCLALSFALSVLVFCSWANCCCSVTFWPAQWNAKTKTKSRNSGRGRTLINRNLI